VDVADHVAGAVLEAGVAASDSPVYGIEATDDGSIQRAVERARDALTAK
jgi:hypothetical protein